MAITQTIATLPAVLNDSATFYEDIAERNNSLVTTVLPSINAWATQANALAGEVNDKAAQVAAQAVDGGYSQNYINTNFIGVNNAQDITEVKTFIASPIVPTPAIATQAVNKEYVDNKPSGFKNLIVNGRKQVNQSGLITTDNSYNYDNHYKVGNNWFVFIEGLDIESGSEYTLSWEGIATASYYIGTAGSSTINAQSFTAISNGGTITPTITSSQLLWIKFESDSTGSTYNKVQFEKGTVDTPFEHRLHTDELRLVQKYLFVATTGASSSTEVIGHGHCAGTALQRVLILFPVKMRTAPTFFYISGSDSSTITDISGTPSSSFYLNNTTSLRTNIERTVTGGISGAAGHIRVNAVSNVLMAFAARP